MRSKDDHLFCNSSFPIPLSLSFLLLLKPLPLFLLLLLALRLSLNATNKQNKGENLLELLATAQA